MTGVSVIIVSRNRPAAVSRCLAGLRQSDHPDFEVVVVADPAGLIVAGAGIKAIAYDRPNISVARNLGLAAASGAVVAFIDDDAVPEPTWLTRLVTAFDDPAVSAAAGYVRGRDGIALEWQAQVMDKRGQAQPLVCDAAWTTVHHGRAGLGIVTIGTNMAVRRDVLLRMGGFDPAYRYFLDESDVNMRLAVAGHGTAIVPLAQVHHASAASERRRSDRAPLSLNELGASTAVFLRKYAQESDRAGALDALRLKHRQTALRRMVSGRMEPRDVKRLLATLEQGIRDGLARRIADLPPIPAATAPFLPFSGTGPKPGAVFAGWFWNRRRLHADALRLRAAGTIVTVMTFTPSALHHHMRFSDSGFWEQRGGVFGRSSPSGPLVRFTRLRDRIRRECAGLASFRPLD